MNDERYGTEDSFGIEFRALSGTHWQRIDSLIHYMHH